jgi:hypothetical protein
MQWLLKALKCDCLSTAPKVFNGSQSMAIFFKGILQDVSLFLFFLMVLGLNSGPWTCLGECSPTWVMLPDLVALGYYSDTISCFFPGPAWDHDRSTYASYSSWDYRHEPPDPDVTFYLTKMATASNSSHIPTVFSLVHSNVLSGYI